MAQRYETYKDSGVQWLAEIPSHWECVPFKYVFALGKGLSITKTNLVEEGIKVVSYGQIHSKLNKYTHIVPELFRYVEDSYLEYDQCLAEKEDFLIADTSEDIEGSGNFVRVDRHDCIFAGYHTILAKNKMPEHGAYLAYLMQSNLWKKQIWVQVHGVKLYSITKGILHTTKFLLPPLPEQHSIVTYLDDKCMKIDEWLSKKQKEVEHLKELKQCIIADAVTRGLNPDVKMKETGISWLPEVPNNWEMVRVKALFENIREKNNPIQTEERLSLSIDKGVTLYSEKTTNLDRFKEDCTQYLLARQNDIVLNSMNMIVGAVGKSKYFGCVSPAYYVIRLRDLQNQIDYYSLLLNIQKIRDVYRILGKGIMAIDRGDGKVNTCRLKVPYDDFGAIKVPVPPISEQKAIITYITDKTSKIDKLIASINKEIEGIKEYKQRLISDVVTGQIKVC